MPQRPLRFIALGSALVALLVALWAGLLRLGLTLPELSRELVSAHGPLMVAGFLGTVISLERAVAIGRRWAYAAPMLSGLGTAAMFTGLPVWTAALAVTASAAVLVAIFGVILWRLTALFTVIMTLGAVAWLGGNALWLAGEPVQRAVPWWTAFLVLTIAGERLDLSRLRQPSARARAWFIIAAALLVTGVLAGHWEGDAGARLAGAGLLLMPVWLARYDVAERTIRGSGLSRFIATCVLSGYTWLAAGGLLLLWHGATLGGPVYDAQLHTVFVGFVFGMIIAHAPIILPAITGQAVPYRPMFYAPLLLLHLSLLLRVGGDLAGTTSVRQAGGVLNEVAMLLFFVVTAAAVRMGRRPPAAAGTDSAR